MTLRKKILLSITFIPLILLLLVLVRPVREGDQHNTIELLFLIIGLPILLINYLEWSDTQFLDGIFGKSRPGTNLGPLSIPLKNMLARFTPQGMPVWKVLAVMTSLLLLGFTLGAGALFIMNQQLPRASVTRPGAYPAQSIHTPTRLAPNQVGTIVSSAITGTQPPASPNPTVAETFPTATGDFLTSATSPVTGELPTPATPPATENFPIPGSPSATVESTTPGTPNTSRCISPTQLQFATIQAGVKILDSNYDIKTGFVVQSLAADGLWFFAAKVYSPDLYGGVSVEPAVWSFFQNNNTPYNIYAVNDIAFQYSDFNLGQLANPPINMQVNSADIVFLCSQNGN